MFFRSETLIYDGRITKRRQKEEVGRVDLEYLMDLEKMHEQELLNECNLIRDERGSRRSVRYKARKIFEHVDHIISGFRCRQWIID